MSDQTLYRRIAQLENWVAELIRRNEESDRKTNNMLRQGRVTAVDPAKGTVQLAYSTDDEGNDVVSPPIPWVERAGSIKSWSPPSVGEQVNMFSPSGEVNEASWVLPGGFSNSNSAPHDKSGEHKIQIGGASILMTGEKITFTAGTIVLDGATHLGGEGGQLVHRKGDVDSDGDSAVGSASKVYAV